MPTREPSWLQEQAQSSLKRLLPRLEGRFKPDVDVDDWLGYRQRLATHFPPLFACLYELYGDQYDFFFHLEGILVSATEHWIARPQALKAQDALRSTDPDWFKSHRMVGAMCYVDLIAGDLQGLREHIPYLIELGVNYLHLMPLFKEPEGDNDGGYAVSSFREVNAAIGTMEQLAELAAELRLHQISLCLDFVFNHTADDHEWARLALAGEKEYQGYYLMFPDRTEPDAYERTLTPIFPDEHPGAFTYRNRIRKWVWTSFHNYQWDLNYANPQVFNAMTGEMLFLANQGIEILRLDAIAFLWKEKGASCQNLPQAHTLIRAFNALARIAAPALVLKSEAIVHPDEVRKYVREDECRLSYNPQLMALLWSTLATRDVRLMTHALRRGFDIPGGCAWVNYIRCHDDIGWGFADEDVLAVNQEPGAHRRFLTAFYTGRFEGSFAHGLPFQEDPATGDARVSGTTASLVGLEGAMAAGNEQEIELAIRRLLLLHGVIMTIGGIPLLYLGDEIGALNDYSYTADPEKDGDSRWVHRPAFDWERAELRRDPASIPGRIFQGLRRLIGIRQQNLGLSRAETEIVDTGNPRVFGYFSSHHEHGVLVLANFSEHVERLEAKRLRLLGLRKTVVDMVSGRTITATHELVLEPYAFMVLARPVRP